MKANTEENVNNPTRSGSIWLNFQQSYEKATSAKYLFYSYSPRFAPLVYPPFAPQKIIMPFRMGPSLSVITTFQIHQGSVGEDR